jgi:hypothetical protein
LKFKLKSVAPAPRVTDPEVLYQEIERRWMFETPTLLEVTKTPAIKGFGVRLVNVTTVES